jgi:hypothetical protein
MRNPPGTNARSRDSSVRRTDLERELLRQLCRATLGRRARSRIARELREYEWQDIEHGLVYAAIERLGSLHPKMLAAQLPAEATRMGFPDVDWKEYFSPEGERSRPLSVAQLARQIRRMMGPTRTAFTGKGNPRLRRPPSA